MQRISFCGALFALALSCTSASAQSNPAFSFGQVPTPAQWNAAFARKQDYLGFSPLNKSGDTLLGKLNFAPSTVVAPSLNIAPGVAPLLPNDGDLWALSNGLFTRIGGTVYNLLAPSFSQLNGTASTSQGGTGATSFQTGMPIFGNGTGPLYAGSLSGQGSVLATVTGGFINGHCLAANSGNIIDSGAPCGGGSGGSGTVTAGTANQMAYYSSAGTAVAGLSTIANGFLAADSNGVPKYLTGPQALTAIGGLPLAGGTMTGPLAAQILTATDPGTSAGNPFVLTSKEATNTGGGFRYGFLMNHERLANGIGNRTAGVFAQAVDTTSQGSDQIVGLEPIGILKSGVVAQAYGSNPVCQTLPGTAVGAGCSGEEIDINSAATGLTRRTGLQIYDIGSAAPASQIDAALFFAGNPSTSPPSMPFNNGILFGYAGNNSTINVATTGCMICAGAPGTVAGGLDFHLLNISGAFLSGPQGTFTVDGAGNTTVGKTSAPANLTVTNNIAALGNVATKLPNGCNTTDGTISAGLGNPSCFGVFAGNKTTLFPEYAVTGTDGVLAHAGYSMELIQGQTDATFKGLQAGLAVNLLSLGNANANPATNAVGIFATVSMGPLNGQLPASTWVFNPDMVRRGGSGNTLSINSEFDDTNFSSDCAPASGRCNAFTLWTNYNGTAYANTFGIYASAQSTYTRTGTVNTNGTAVTYGSGSQFESADSMGATYAGQFSTITINGTLYRVASINSATSLTLATSAGVQNGVSYSASANAVHDYLHITNALAQDNDIYSDDQSSYMIQSKGFNVSALLAAGTYTGAAIDLSGATSLAGNSSVLALASSEAITFAAGFDVSLSYNANDLALEEHEGGNYNFGIYNDGHVTARSTFQAIGMASSPPSGTKGGNVCYDTNGVYYKC